MKEDRDVYVNKKGTQEVIVTGLSMIGGISCVDIETVNSMLVGTGRISVEEFESKYKLKTPKKQNVNQDILKFIEAGYEFSSFWGDTVDGRSINVDLNEEEVK